MRRLAFCLGACLILMGQASPALGATGRGVLADPGSRHVQGTTFGSLGSQGSATDGATITVVPVVTNLAGGVTETTYSLPDGEVITSTTPPPGFDPLTASDDQLMRFDFPLRPGDAPGLKAWISAMSAFTSDEPSAEPLHVASANDAARPSSTTYATSYSNWAGYIAGTLNVQNHMYVAVKGNIVVPTNTGTCALSNNLGIWIGLGGTSSNPENLVQQGIACGNPSVGSGSAYRPFTEFANTRDPVAFCGFTSWTLAHGDVIYQNMSFQSSVNKAFFYLEDQTSGVAHSCSATAPSSWTFDGNSAEWIAEAPTGTAINFHSVRFTNAHAELGSNSTWVTLGSQPTTKTIEGSSSTTYCIAPGSIGTDHASFTDTWHQATCY
jgi:hypothetical protein